MMMLTTIAMAAAAAIGIHPPGGSTGGGGGGGAPVIMFTDFVAGPTTGGDGNNGAFLSLYGFNLDTYANWGVTNHVTIGGVEVANYRCLGNAVGSGSGIGRGVYDTWGLQCLTVQVGALGSPTAGTALKIDMTIGGVHPLNATDGSGNYLGYAEKMDGTRPALTFTPQPGAIYFIDRVNGSDANSGLTVALPKKTLQGSTGFTGVFLCATAAGATNGMKPGTHVYDLGGTANAGGLSGSAVGLFRISGTLPTGGTNRGPICYTRYPGAAGANSPANVVIQGVIDGSGNGGGGFFGNDQARAGETNPYDGLTGWGRSIHISNVKIISSANGARDGCPINLASSADDWRVTNCDLSWPWVSSASNITNAAGIAGNGTGVTIQGNYIHDIQGVLADNQNHGIYIDGSRVCANDVTVFMTCIYRITAGNGIQSFNSQASGSIQNISILNNWVELTNKHGLNVADNTSSRYDRNNIVVDSGEAGYNVSTGAVTAAAGVKQSNNVFYGWARVVNSRPAWWNQGIVGTSPASTDSRDSIYMQKAGSTGTYSFVVTNGGTDTFSKNIWFDAAGILSTKPAADSTGSYHDPQLVSVATHDFTPATGSFAIDFGNSPLVTRAFDFFGHAVTGTPDAGAIERGATF
jgi:hypothetical protein